MYLLVHTHYIIAALSPPSYKDLIPTPLSS